MSDGFGWLKKDREVAQRDIDRAYGWLRREVGGEKAEAVPMLGNRIGGKSVPPATGAYLDDVNPANQRLVCKIPRSDARDVDAAVAAARAAQPGWARRSLQSRCAVLEKAAGLLERDLDRLARLEVEDTGKPLALATTLDIPRAARNFRFFADFAAKHKDPEHPMEGHTNRTVRSPVGIVGLVTPWNLPLYLLSWKVAPALALGNAVVAKPSQLTPQTADALADILAEAGLPDGLYNVVHGLGPEAGQPLVEHPHVKAISFTGGTATGAKVAAAAASRVKKLSLELGGKNPSIVFADCDLDATVAGVARSAFANSGQICLCGSRVLVERAIHDRFVAALAKHVEGLKVGDPLDPVTDVGPLSSLAHREKVEGYLELARREGATFVTGGGRPKLAGALADGAFLEPTLIAGLGQDSRCVQEEIFGPVATIQPFSSEAEAVALANDVRYGLAASVWTRDEAKAERVAEALEAGMVWVNCWLVRDLAVPFGGLKDSGVGREGGAWSVDFYSEARNICVKASGASG